MDRNTITGIILIFLIFIGFSIYNNSRLKKGYEQAISVAESYYKKGELENARAEYINALRFRPNYPDAVAKINELNLKLGITTEEQVSDTTAVSEQQSEISSGIETGDKGVVDASAYGVFASSASGENEFITLENNKVELKIALKGGRVYSARLKDYRTHDSLPLILFSGDSTVYQHL